MKIVFASLILSVLVISGRTKAVLSSNELVEAGVSFFYFVIEKKFTN